MPLYPYYVDAAVKVITKMDTMHSCQVFSFHAYTQTGEKLRPVYCSKLFFWHLWTWNENNCVRIFIMVNLFTVLTFFGSSFSHCMFEEVYVHLCAKYTHIQENESAREAETYTGRRGPHIYINKEEIYRKCTKTIHTVRCTRLVVSSALSLLCYMAPLLPQLSAL